MPKKEFIEGMFDDIAKDYDRLNHIMSLDVDKSWRRKAIRRILDAPSPIKVLDLACGTGDFSIATAKGMKKKGIEGTVTGVDLSEGMLSVMAEKVSSEGLSEIITMQKGDGENLPFEDGTFDRVSISFGIRNFEDKDKGLREMLRVLKKGGKAVILELSLPENGIVRWLYNLYFLHILPKIGGKVSGEEGAYKYLPASVVNFPQKDRFMEMMRQAGFSEVTHNAFSLGICRMFIGEK